MTPDVIPASTARAQAGSGDGQLSIKLSRQQGQYQLATLKDDIIATHNNAEQHIALLPLL
jgi:hypothetical protein